MRLAGRLRDDRRFRRAHPVHAVVVPEHRVGATQTAPDRSRGRAVARRRVGDDRRGAVEEHGGGAAVLVDAVRSDAQVRLARVAEHHDVVAGVVAHLDAVAEIAHLDLQARDRGGHRQDARRVVGRLRADETVCRRRLGVEHEEPRPEHQEQRGPCRPPASRPVSEHGPWSRAATRRTPGGVSP